jgi:Protein of unknown function (DUF4089)
MAKSRKSRPQAKARATSASKLQPREKPLAGRKPADSPKSGTARPADPLDDFVQAAARVLALPLEPDWLAAIKFNLEVNLRLAAFVAEFALPDESEPAPVFTA